MFVEHCFMSPFVCDGGVCCEVQCARSLFLWSGTVEFEVKSFLHEAAHRLKYIGEYRYYILVDVCFEAYPPIHIPKSKEREMDVLLCFVVCHLLSLVEVILLPPDLIIGSLSSGHNKLSYIQSLGFLITRSNSHHASVSYLYCYKSTW